jgi:hypothetical protein
VSAPIAGLNQGDEFEHEGTRYMAMIRVRRGWGCRPLLPTGQWGEHVWFKDVDDNVEVVKRKPQRNKKAKQGTEDVHQLGESRKEWWSV